MRSVAWVERVLHLTIYRWPQFIPARSGGTQEGNVKVACSEMRTRPVDCSDIACDVSHPHSLHRSDQQVPFRAALAQSFAKFIRMSALNFGGDSYVHLVAASIVTDS